MKNRTFVRFFTLFLAVMMTMGMFALCASAEKKTVYDEENCAIEYEDGVVTVKLNAEKLGKIIEDRTFSKAVLEEILPEGLYKLIDERSKAAVVAFILNLAEKKIFSYNEMLKIFDNNEAVMKKYVNLDLFAAFFTPEELSAALKYELAEGAMDEFFNADGVRDGLYDKLGVATDEETLDDFNAFLEAVKDIEKEKGFYDKEIQVLLPIRGLTGPLSMKAAIKNASGDTDKNKTIGFFEQVLFGEVNEMAVNGLTVYSDYLFDHNALQTALLQGLPTADELALAQDGDTIAEYVFTSTGDNIDMTGTVRIVLFGDTTVINQNAAKVASFFSYAVADDGLISVSIYFDGRFAENYAKVLNCDEISTERKLEYLGLYTADAAAMQAQMKCAKFDEFLADAKAAAVKGSSKIDPNMDKILKVRNYILKAAAYETAYTTLDDAYQGNGVFVLRLTEVIPFDTIEEKVQSRFSSIDEVLKWLKTDDHIVDTEITFTIEDFYRVRFFDADSNLLYVTYLPVGTDLSLFDTEAALDGHGEDGWFDINGDAVTVTGEGDLDLFEVPETVALEINKIWDDDDNRDGLRPDAITVIIYGNGQEVARKNVTTVRSDTVGLIDEDEILVDETWSFIVAGLPKYENGEEIEYTIGEDEVDGYIASIEGLTITNVHEPEMIEIAGSKVWNDPNTKDTKRPESITVILYANGEEERRINVQGEGDVWDFTFGERYKYEDGVEIVYTIDEVDVAGYQKEINGFEIVNSGLLELSLFVVISLAAAGGIFTTVRVMKKRKDQE